MWVVQRNKKIVDIFETDKDMIDHALKHIYTCLNNKPYLIELNDDLDEMFDIIEGVYTLRFKYINNTSAISFLALYLCNLDYLFYTKHVINMDIEI